MFRFELDGPPTVRLRDRSCSRVQLEVRQAFRPVRAGGSRLGSTYRLDLRVMGRNGGGHGLDRLLFTWRAGPFTPDPVQAEHRFCRWAHWDGVGVESRTPPGGFRCREVYLTARLYRLVLSPGSFRVWLPTPLWSREEHRSACLSIADLVERPATDGTHGAPGPDSADAPRRVG